MKRGSEKKWVVFWDIDVSGGLQNKHGTKFWTVQRQVAPYEQNLAEKDESDGVSVETEVQLCGDEVPEDDVDHDPAEACDPTDVQDCSLTTNGMS